MKGLPLGRAGTDDYEAKAAHLVGGIEKAAAATPAWNLL